VSLVDLPALKAKLAEYDPDRERCDGLVSKAFVDDSGARFVLRHACCRPKGHEGDCRNSRAILGYPGYKTLMAMVEEIEHLRSLPKA